MTDQEALTIAGCLPAVAAILADHIEAGRSDATAYCGPAFCDYQALAVQAAINTGKGDALALEHTGIAPELAKAIAGAINSKGTLNE